MGNQIVIPASKDWWSNILNSNNYIIRAQFQSGSLFLKFICTDKSKNEQFIVKAYQNEHLSQIPYYKKIKEYFEIMLKLNVSMIRYLDIIETPNSAFLIRRKLGQPLSDVISQEPSLYVEEKFWITYQLFKAIETFHKNRIFHGDLKPCNILFIPSGRVYIVDPAPFKPYTLDQDHPHYYYYFFANDDSLGCYIAPERLLGKLALTNDIPINDLILADLFSLGCIIAYMYLNGEPLFTQDTLRKYDKDKKSEDLENALNSINDKKIIDLIKGLISLNPQERLKTFESFLKTGFPSDFQNLYEKFYPAKDYLLMNSKSPKERLDFSQISKATEGQSFVQSIIEQAQNLKKNSKKPLTVGSQMIFYNFISYKAVKSESLTEVLYIINHVLDFTDEFDVEMKIMRLIPFLVKLLDFDSLLIRRKVLFSFIRIFKSITVIPDELKDILKGSIFHILREKFIREGISLAESYLVESEAELSSRSSLTLIKEVKSMDSYLGLIAEFLPFFSYEVFRLQPENLKDCLITFSIPKNNLEIFKIFSKSMQEVAKNGSYFFYYNFSSFLFEFFNNEIDFKIEYVQILTEIYSYAEENKKMYYIYDLNIILPHIIRSICPNSNISFTEFNDVHSKNGNINIAAIDNTMVNAISKTRPGLPPEWDGPDCFKWENYTCLTLKFFICLLEKGILDGSFTLAISYLMIYLLNSKSEKVFFLLSVLVNYFTPYAQQLPLFSFIIQRLAEFKGARKDSAHLPDPISLKEKQKYSTSERIKFANPFIPRQVITSKKIRISPGFISSFRGESECVTDIAIESVKKSDKNICVYALNNKKLRYFKFSTVNNDDVSIMRFNDEINNNLKDNDISYIEINPPDNCIFDHHLVVAHEKGRIDCIDLNRESFIYTKPAAASTTGTTFSNIPIVFKPKNSRKQTTLNNRLFNRNRIDCPQSHKPPLKKIFNVESNGQGSYKLCRSNSNTRDMNEEAKKAEFFLLQEKYRNGNDSLTSFCSLKTRCCIVSGKWNGTIDIIDIRDPESAAMNGSFGSINKEYDSISFKFKSLVSLAASPVNEDYLYAGFASGLVFTIDLRVGLPVSETLTIPAMNIWPVATPSNSKSSCFAVYDGESTVQFYSEPKNNIVQTIHGKNFVGTTFNGGVVLADDYSASYVDLLDDGANRWQLYDGSVRRFSPEKSQMGKSLASPDFDGDELMICDQDQFNDPNSNYKSNGGSFSASASVLAGEDTNAVYDRVERELRRNFASVHMHKSQVKCIAKYKNLFVTGDSSGFVNLWSICSTQDASAIATDS